MLIKIFLNLRKIVALYSLIVSLKVNY